MSVIREVAPAKINLALHVRRRRADGYHEIETLFAFAQDGDVLTLERAADWSLTVTGPFADALPVEARVWGAANLVPRAALAFEEAFGGARYAITLDKRLPVASGIGGGSADAAAVLRALAREARVERAAMDALALSLGADVPACLHGRTTLGTGVGERLVPVAGATGMPLLLVNPGVGVSTAAVFAGWDGEDRGALHEGTLIARARAGRNDLEPAATAIAPVIAEVRAALDAAPGVVLSRMSGSGATCFALFEDAAARDAASRRICAEQPGWWRLESALA